VIIIVMFINRKTSLEVNSSGLFYYNWTIIPVQLPDMSCISPGGPGGPAVEMLLFCLEDIRKNITEFCQTSILYKSISYTVGRNKV